MVPEALGPVVRPPTLDEERRLWRAGFDLVAGVDEVGRGAWAGPVSVGVAVVPTRTSKRSVPRELRDSKLVSERRRESMFDEIAAWCANWAVGHATAGECDRLGMTAALQLAAARALAALRLCPDAVLLDGPFDFLQAGVRSKAPTDEPLVGAPTVIPIVDADRRCASVAAASILAKVVRDRIMRDEAEHFPQYHFERNKGYPSWAHRTALAGYGLSAIHRRSWVFVDGIPWHAPGARSITGPNRSV